MRTRKATQEKRLDKESRKDLESTVQELSDMHGEKYTEAQLRVWARLVVNGLHKDMDSPPNIPIISGEPVKKKRKIKAPKENDSLTDVIKTAVSAFAEKLGSPSRCSSSPKAACGISPSTKAKVSSEYLGQLSSLRELLEKGVLSDEEFQEQKRFALSNLRSLNKEN